MSKKSGISLRIDDEKIEKLDHLSKITKRDRSFHINEAIENYLEVQEWQLRHIKDAIAEANNDEFASHKDLQKVLGR